MADKPAAFDGETGAAGAAVALEQHPVLETDAVEPRRADPFI
jgi:hypothetical protein